MARYKWLFQIKHRWFVAKFRVCCNDHQRNRERLVLGTLCVMQCGETMYMHMTHCSKSSGLSVNITARLALLVCLLTTHTHTHTHTPSLSLQEGYTPTPTCSYLCLAQLLQEEPTMISRSTPSHCHTLTGDFELGGKNKSLYGSIVWHGCVSEYACMCDYIPKRRALLVST